jgi:DNA polymerase III sliding clamp (beta) subunit (PCNA family)
VKAVFENATIADSIQKAARVAPSKGEAFDKASGIMMELDSTDNTVTIRSTNLDIFYLEVVDAIEVEGDSAWRFHAITLPGVLSKLPIGSGKTVSFEQVHGEVHVKSGRTTAKFRLMDASHFPEWKPFDPELLELVPDLGARIKQVEWAAGTDSNMAFSGIHIDGQHLITTDRYRLAVVDCDSERALDEPVTIPAGILKPLLSGLRDIAIGVLDGNFLMMPDQSTQIQTRIFQEKFPTVLPLMDRNWPNSVKFKKTGLLQIIERAVVFAQRERDPKLSFFIGKGEIGVMCADQEMGLLGDVIEISSQADHARMKILYTPKNLQEALENCPSDEVVFYYDATNPQVPTKLDGGSGFQALVMPRKEKNTDA